MASFSSSSFSTAAYSVLSFFFGSGPPIEPDNIDTHDGGPAKRKRSSQRPRKERESREELLRQIKLAYGVLDETPATIETAEKVVAKAKKFIPSALNINLTPVIEELAKLERALEIFRTEQEERNMEEEIILMLV